MHKAVFDFVARRLPLDITKTTTVVEFGSRDVNGTIRPLLGQADYTGVDIEEGPNVDVVMDATLWEGKADIILCLEVLEHTPDLKGFAQAIVSNLNPNGIALVTCATHGRTPHSAIDGGAVRKDEHYKNVDPTELAKAISKAGGHIHHEEINIVTGDLRAEIHVN